MSTPSKKALIDGLGLEAIKAKILKDLLVSSDESSDAKKVDQALEFANDALDGYGVEAIRGDYQSRYWQDIVALYVNLGDTYDTTLLYVTGADKFLVTSWGDWGDWVERFGDKYGVA